MWAFVFFVFLFALLLYLVNAPRDYKEIRAQQTTNAMFVNYVYCLEMIFYSKVYMFTIVTSYVYICYGIIVI